MNYAQTSPRPESVRDWRPRPQTWQQYQRPADRDDQHRNQDQQQPQAARVLSYEWILAS